MAENRLTFHNGYRNRNGKAYNTKHNDREGFEKPKNADENEYWDYQQWGSKNFSESEKTFYKYAFGDHVKAHNEKCKKRRQYARCTTVEEYREKHPPEETLLYIGTKNVDPEKLKAVFEDFREWIKEECNTPTCGIELLNAALHMDETTPHIQFRKVYWYTDKDGNAQISQTKALKELGYERPDETEKEGRFNNVKQTFDAVCRVKLFEFAKSHGVELIEEPLPKDQVGLSIDEYRAREQARETWKAEQQSLCAETEKARRELKEVQNTMFENEKAIISQKKELQKLDKFQEYLDEQEREEQERVKEEREQLKREFKQTLQPVTAEKIASRENPQKAAEEENARKSVQNASETPETVSAYPDTPKTQKPSNGAYTRLEHTKAENNKTITAEEAADLLQLP